MSDRRVSDSTDSDSSPYISYDVNPQMIQNYRSLYGNTENIAGFYMNYSHRHTKSFYSCSCCRRSDITAHITPDIKQMTVNTIIPSYMFTLIKSHKIKLHLTLVLSVQHYSTNAVSITVSSQITTHIPCVLLVNLSL